MSFSFLKWLFLFCLFLPISILPQKERLRFEHLNVKDGLPESCVGAIFQDHLGFLWFGTTLGLAQYDGYKMNTYKFEAENATVGNHITDIDEDKDGNIWVVGWSGLTKFERKTKSFTNYPHTSKKIYPTQGILNLLIDSAGMIWVATFENKLFRFNPTTAKFKYFNTLGVAADWTTNACGDGWLNWLLDGNLLEDDSGDIWIGSASKGLFYIPKGTDKLNVYKHYENDQNSISSDSIVYIHQDIEGTIWIATMGGGLNSFDKKTQKFFQYKHQLGNQNSLIDNRVFGIYEDKTGLLWVSTLGGIDILDTDVGIIQHLTPDPERKEQNIFPIFEDDRRNIWLLDYGMNGLAFYDRESNSFKHYRNIPDDPNSFASGYENWTYLVDGTKIIWVGTWGSGVNKLDLFNQGFTYFIPDKKNYDPLIGDLKGNVICEDPSGNIIIGSFGKGLHIFTPDGKLLKSFKHDKSNPGSISSDYVSACYIDREGVIWIGTAEQDLNKEPVLNKYDKSKEKFEHFTISNPKIEWGYPIWKIYQDHSGKYWIGTQVGLYEFNKEKGDFTFYQVDSAAATIHNRMDAIIEDKQQRLWIGTDGLGLIEFERESKKSNRYLGTESIMSIVLDSTGKLWLGSLASGLILFDPETKQSDYISKKYGPQNFVTLGILSDDKGNIWISTKNGLIKYNPRTKSFKKYDKADGLEVEEFNLHAMCKTSSGKMYLEGDRGLITFYPDEIKDDPYPPNVVITDLSLFNSPEEKLEFEKDISELKEVELSYNQNDIHIEFVALHYGYPANNKYKYKLENSDEDWIDAGTQRIATYTNLDPGEYIFKVKGSNCNGVWNEAGTSIKIIINPPLWATTWAYLLYVLLTLSSIYFLWKLNVRRIKTKHEFEMSKFEAEKLHEVDELKSRFFTNISHEFRTPLTLILGPAKDVLDNTKETKTKQNIGLIRRNAGRLLGLVNQLLDLSKLEAGRMKLETREEDIIPLLKGLALSFSSLAERKKITLKFNSIEEKVNIYLDRDKFEKIINNLLSNAFKFTPDGGKIDVTVEKMIKELEIRISDSGTGISKGNIDKIFDRFYQVDGSHIREQEGTGIGLALTKELVELHKGKIEVESEEGKGTTFIVKIPLCKDHLKPEEIIEVEVKVEEHPTIDETEMIPETNAIKEKTDFEALLETDKPLLLIVEDNSDVRKYIISHLENNYSIQEAVDGEDGLEQAFNHIPDLIISDVMMPRMDGFELCNKLKTDEKTSHIPIIMLTAKATNQDKIAGYETGADDYIMKPFDAAELKVRIKNLIETRKKLQEKFRKADFVIKRGEIKINSLDEKFIEKLMLVIEKHISEERFTIEEFESEIAMSKSQIYRKLKALTGKSPSRFLRSVRLSKARKMILEHQATISEIAYSMGFGSPAYFTKCFKEEYGHSPSEMLS